jgi:hypothetical protein
MWMTREQIAEALGIVPNSVRGKVMKGQIERKVEGGKNYYRIADREAFKQRSRLQGLPAHLIRDRCCWSNSPP